MKLLGFICWITKRHKWRRMRKGEKSYIPSEQQPFGPVSNYKVCRHFEIVRALNKRKTNPVSAVLAELEHK